MLHGQDPQRFVIFDIISMSVYLEDILVHSTDEETHKTHLMEVFNRFSAAGVT